MLKNLSENAKRHGKAKTIKLSVTKDHKDISFLLEDDGAGFSGNKKSDITISTSFQNQWEWDWIVYRKKTNRKNERFS